MVLRRLCAGLALAAMLATVGCCHSCKRTAGCCPPPAVVNTAPIAYPPPDANGVGPAPINAYSPQAPCGNGLPH
jgi:hypothetical protein